MISFLQISPDSTDVPKRMLIAWNEFSIYSTPHWQFFRAERSLEKPTYFSIKCFPLENYQCQIMFTTTFPLNRSTVLGKRFFFLNTLQAIDEITSDSFSHNLFFSTSWRRKLCEMYYFYFSLSFLLSLDLVFHGLYSKKYGIREENQPMVSDLILFLSRTNA